MSKTYNRRTFLEFLGKGTAGAILVPTFAYACSEPSESVRKKRPFKLVPIDPTEVDDLILAEGFKYDILIRWGDSINGEDTFGFNNDFTQFLEGPNKNMALLWVNHEYVDSRFVGKLEPEKNRTAEQVSEEMYNVGGSFIALKQVRGKWSFVPNHELNRRITGTTKIPFNWDHEIAGSTYGIGTLANCSGGLTPWGNILTCEENYDSCYGETIYENGEAFHIGGYHEWDVHFPEHKPEHYGWVVEVNPKTGEAQKHIALGRCAHECAKVHELSDKRLVVYTGDDGNDRCLYKFVGSVPGSLKEGTLYVADLEKNEWVAVDWSKHEILQEHFKDQTEVLVRLREAAPMIGGSPLDRPEDIEIDPLTGSVLVATTNNKNRDNYYGQIMKFDEVDGYDGLRFEHDVFLAGGQANGFACPDNMAFDPKGNLWFTCDISGGAMGLEPYEHFKNNGLFVVLREGKHAGKPLQIGSAPTHAEFTGPCFSPDGKTLFLSVQHPGEYSESIDNLSSHWPDGGDAIPKPSVVTITGEALEAIMEGRLA